MQHSYSICVFCGASPQVDLKYFTLAKKLGLFLAENKYQLIYGGSSVGLMGALSDAVLDNEGEVIGIYPNFDQPTGGLQPIEPANMRLTDLILVQDLSQRKKIMIDKSDAFLILPGGFGTLDEAFEVITWKYINNLTYPIIFFNYEGYYNELLEMIEKIYQSKFATDKIRFVYHVIDNFEDLSEILSSASQKAKELI